MLGVLGVYVASALAWLSLTVAYVHVSSAKSFVLARSPESSNFHLMTFLSNLVVSVTVVALLGTFVSYGVLISLPLSLFMFAIALRNSSPKLKKLEYDERVDSFYPYNCLTKEYLFVLPPEILGSERVMKLKEMLSEDSRLAVFVRYALVSPASALVAASFYPAFGPIALFAMGYSLQGKMALISAIAGWLGLMASLKGEMGPIVRARLIEEKVKMFFSQITFSEALVLYVLMVLVLSGIATYGFYKKIRKWGIEVVALFIPLVAYAIAENRFGEPLAVASFALGASLAAYKRVVDPLKILERVAFILRKLGAMIVYYDVPLLPYLLISSFFYHLLSVRCVGLRALVEYFERIMPLIS
ncbi:hypothetical protein IPA_08895 [Ignicoccus pacificus DSM 13166]|uniref:Uncharacterized protein n=1 Tax=Ignicoccus pacificus DSM 13166 TaxID=940294 RepID=A0A977KDE5_9CREN|nr:hypothetical protein IPA_08895 [Ignicoccus pacificus DSM 13166]